MAKTSSPAGAADRHDILILGGGLVGASLAIALGQAGLRVALIDRDTPADQVQDRFDGRGSAVSLASKRVLVGLGVWDAIAEKGPILDIRVSDGPSRLHLHYDHRTVGDEPMGWIIENRFLRRALHKIVAQTPNVDWLAPARSTGFERGPGWVGLTLEDGRSLRAPLLVGAEGRSSPTRDWAGISVRRVEYHQTGIVCAVEHEKPHQGIAHERFLPIGPLALLPLEHPNRSSVVWTEDPAKVPGFLALSDEDFAYEIERRFGPWLGKMRMVGPRWNYPLTALMANRFYGDRIVLAGDSAHGVHPIAGQGVNLGWRDVAALAELLVEAARTGTDLGSPALLARYEAWRKPDCVGMLIATDGLNRLFATDFPPVRLARDVGLAVVNRIEPLKRVLIRQAMGVLGNQPKLVRGERV